MCGRFTLTAEPTLLAERLAIDLAGVSWQPSYNIAPSQPVLVILNDGALQASQLR
jgi:putative SOS response-associated peptidase YedK